MSIDLLQEKIRKFKNPSIVYLDARMQTVPPCIDGDPCQAYGKFAMDLIDALKDVVPALRFSFAGFAMLGDGGLLVLSQLMRYAKKHGYYVLLDLPELYCNLSAENMAGIVSQDDRYDCHAFVISSYCGSDVIRPFLSLCKSGKSVFCIVRTANKSATEIQDLLTGARLVHTAAADVVYRYAQTAAGKSGYFQLAAVAAASSADSLRNLRTKYKGLFLLLDGYDYPNSNAKNCSFAFDSLGHGAVACAGTSVTCAWKEEDSNPQDYAQLAVQAALRMKKNLTRYISVL